MPIGFVAMAVTSLSIYPQVQMQVTSITLVCFDVVVDARSRRPSALLQTKGTADLLWAVFALQP
jgi:hypothetical protein